MEEQQPDRAPDLVSQAISFRRGGLPARRRSERYYRTLYRIYLGLLLFVVLAGLPVVGIPALRQKLASRIQVLREALSGSGRTAAPAVLAQVGENTEPFPKEYEIPLQTWGKDPGILDLRMPVFRAGGHQSGVRQESAPDAPPEKPEAADTGGTEPAVSFRQGNPERQAYETLLKSSETIAGLVQGKDAALRFVKWAAAKREEETYWVDLTFASSAEGPESHYIWQVNLATGSTTPLSAHARALMGSGKQDVK